MSISRREMLVHTGLLAGVTAMGRFAVADSSGTPTSGADANLFARLDEYVRQYMEEMKSPGMTANLNGYLCGSELPDSDWRFQPICVMPAGFGSECVCSPPSYWSRARATSSSPVPCSSSSGLVTRSVPAPVDHSEGVHAPPGESGAVVFELLLRITAPFR